MDWTKSTWRTMLMSPTISWRSMLFFYSKAWRFKGEKYRRTPSMVTWDVSTITTEKAVPTCFREKVKYDSCTFARRSSGKCRRHAWQARTSAWQSDRTYVRAIPRGVLSIWSKKSNLVLDWLGSFRRIQTARICHGQVDWNSVLCQAEWRARGSSLYFIKFHFL